MHGYTGGSHRLLGVICDCSLIEDIAIFHEGDLSKWITIESKRKVFKLDLDPISLCNLRQFSAELDFKGPQQTAFSTHTSFCM